MGLLASTPGTNRSLTIEAMTVTEAERQWVLSAIDSVFGDMHRHERLVETLDQSLDCRRTRLYGAGLAEFVEKWDLRTRGLDMTVPESLFEAPLPVVTAYLRSLFQAEGYVMVRRALSGCGAGHDLRRYRSGAADPALTLWDLFADPASGRSPLQSGRVVGYSRSGTLGDRVTFANEIGFIDPAKEEKLLRSLELEGHKSKADQAS